jgi:hypothetical protein
MIIFGGNGAKMFYLAKWPLVRWVRKDRDGRWMKIRKLRIAG